MDARPRGTTAATLVRFGFADAARAETLWSDRALDGLTLDDSPDGLVAQTGRVADPDAALLGLVRLLEAAGSQRADLVAALNEPGAARERLLGVLGSSAALVDHLVAHPEQWAAAGDATWIGRDERRAAIAARVAPLSTDEAVDELRVAYREQLLAIAALDVTAPDPLEVMPAVAAALADLADAALDAALDIAKRDLGEAAQSTGLAIIAMGKTGARELNYISDVDVIFVAEPAQGADEAAAAQAATDLATRVMRYCSASTATGSLWEVDPALRPEGKAGPLVRTVASHRDYYERHAKTWEFQALLKARPAAGDPAVGAAYCEAVNPFVWEASSRENFVVDARAMRRRVEEHIPAQEVGRELKLGPGGLRDVEFSIQLLQLVHGRTDPSVRVATTLEALANLAAGGYVGREDATTLDGAYRFLRCIEHRIQLYRLRRTHLMPTASPDLRRLGRALGYQADPAEAIEARRAAVSREVRRLHERIFFSPLLTAVTRLSAQEVRLTPDAARERFAALGFADPAGALRHLQSLTEGVSRRAAIQRQLLPVMLGWFADEADPDAALLAFRKISDELGSTHWYLRMLRDEGSAAQQLAHTLGRSRFVAGLIEQAPECVQFFGDPKGLQPRDRDDLVRRMRLAAGRRDDPVAAIEAARVIRRSELVRIAVADLEGLIGLDDLGVAMTDLTSALLEVALEVVTAATLGESGPLADIAIIGMGRFGGAEQGYGSDADVLFVHRPTPGASEADAQNQASDVVRELVRILGLRGPDPSLAIDAGLRPEGKNGPLMRSLASYQEYYERWSLVWEHQALLRARPVAGNEEVGAAFTALIDPLRWPDGGLSAQDARDIRTLKARMEAERLPRGADRKTHFKLGHGGLSDVEWVVQLKQLQHAHEVADLRTTSTMGALAACREHRLIPPHHADDLAESWRLASSLRNAGVLLRGKSIDSVPADAQLAEGVARIVGLPAGSGPELSERYRRVARHARVAYDEDFFAT